MLHSRRAAPCGTVRQECGIAFSLRVPVFCLRDGGVLCLDVLVVIGMERADAGERGEGTELVDGTIVVELFVRGSGVTRSGGCARDYSSLRNWITIITRVVGWFEALVVSQSVIRSHEMRCKNQRKAST